MTEATTEVKREKTKRDFRGFLPDTRLPDKIILEFNAYIKKFFKDKAKIVKIFHFGFILNHCHVLTEDNRLYEIKIFFCEWEYTLEITEIYKEKNENRIFWRRVLNESGKI